MTDETGCKHCDGYGIAYLYRGPEVPPIKCPCLACSPTRNLRDLEAAEAKRDAAYQKKLELEQIAAHNARLNQSAVAQS